MENGLSYQAYLIRLWAAQRGGEFSCRVDLEHINTGEQTSLPGLDALYDFLRTQAESSVANPDQED